MGNGPKKGPFKKKGPCWGIGIPAFPFGSLELWRRSPRKPEMEHMRNLNLKAFLGVGEDQPAGQPI